MRDGRKSLAGPRASSKKIFIGQCMQEESAWPEQNLSIPSSSLMMMMMMMMSGDGDDQVGTEPHLGPTELLGVGGQAVNDKVGIAGVCCEPDRSEKKN